MTFNAFAVKYGITISVQGAEANPQAPRWLNADHYKVTLKRGRKRFTIFYSKGYGHQGAEPTLGEVLCCVALDANTLECSRSFEEWMSEFGFDDDEKRAQRVYKEVTKQTDKLKAFLGDEEYAELLAVEED